LKGRSGVESKKGSSQETSDKVEEIGTNITHLPTGSTSGPDGI